MLKRGSILLCSVIAMGLMIGCQPKDEVKVPKPKKAGYIRMINVTADPLAANFDGQDIGAGMEPQEATGFFRKRPTEHVFFVTTAQGQKVIDSKVKVESDVSYSIVIYKQGADFKFAALEGPVIGKVLNTQVRVANLTDGNVTAILDTGDLSIGESTATNTMSTFLGISAGVQKVIVTLSNGKKVEADFKAEDGKSYTVIVSPGPKGIQTVVALDNPNMAMIQTGEGGA